MKRHEWQFHYSAADLKTAAEKKVEFHTQRLAFWEGKQAEVMGKIKESGLVINESVAAHYSNKSGRTTKVEIDEKLEEDLQECCSKVNEHKNKLKDYEGWVEVMKAQGAESYELNADDWLFFFSDR